MDNTENLMIIAIEEASEVQKAISKALRFGFTEAQTEEIVTEFHQLQAMIEELQKNKVLPKFDRIITEDVKRRKIAKVKHYNEESKKAGRLNDEN